MSKQTDNTKQLDALYNLLARADETYSKLPLKMQLEIEKISQGLPEFGPRKLKRRGPGSEFFESREFHPNLHERRDIHARLSGRAGKEMVIEREAEIRQHIYMWRDPSESMNYGSDPDGFTKRQAAEIMMLGLAKHLARNEEMIGVLDGKGQFRGGKAADSMARRLFDVSIISGEMPSTRKSLPRNSTVMLFSDFLMTPKDILDGLDRLRGKGLQGFLVMVLDPQELDFKFKGHVKFEGMEGEGEQTFKKTEAMRKAYQDKMAEHIRTVRELCKAKGFKFIIQRTDEPLHQSLLEIYGLPPKPAAAKTNTLPKAGP